MSFRECCLGSEKGYLNFDKVRFWEFIRVVVVNVDSYN